METKRCTKCREVKSLDQFNRDSMGKFKRKARCKICTRKATLDWRNRNLERNRENSRRWIADNRDRHLERKRQYHKENADREKAYREEYAHVLWEARYRRRARAYGYEPRVSSFTKGELIERWGDSCAYCGGPFESLDHWPQIVSRGGEHSLTNCRPSCISCNSKSWREDFTPTRDEQG